VSRASSSKNPGYETSTDEAPPIVVAGEIHLDPGAAKDLENGNSRQVQPDAVDMDVRRRSATGQGRPEGRARNVPWNRERLGSQPLTALNFDPGPVTSDTNAERVERPLRMVTRGHDFDDPGAARRVKSGQQHPAFDLGAWHLGFVGDAVQRSAVNREGRPALARVNECPHSDEWIDDPTHGPSLERTVAAHHRPKRVSRYDPREQAHGRSGIGGIEWPLRRLETTHATAENSHGGRPGLPNRDPEPSEAVERGRTVGPRGETGDGRLAVGECSQHGIAVRDGFIARNAYTS